MILDDISTKCDAYTLATSAAKSDDLCVPRTIDVGNLEMEWLDTNIFLVGKCNWAIFTNNIEQSV